MGDVGSDPDDIHATLLEELKHVRRQGFWEFRARDCPTLAQLCGPAPAGQAPEIPIRARLLDLIDPSPLDDRGRPRPRVDLAERPRTDRGLFGRILFGEPQGTLTFPNGPEGRALTLAPRNLQLIDRYACLAQLRDVSDSTINKTPKKREPRGGQAHQFMLDVVELLASGAETRETAKTPVQDPSPGPPAHRGRGRRVRLDKRGLAAALVIATILALIWSDRAFHSTPRPSGCVLLDVSHSTQAVRQDSLQAFGNFAREIGTSGSGRLCILFISGNPLTQSKPTVIDVGPEPGQPTLLAEKEVAANVAAATANVRHALRTSTASHSRGSGVVEGALKASAFLKPGDRLLILSDGIQTTPTTGDFHRIDLSTAGVDSLLGSLEARGFIAHLRNVEIQMPLLLYTPGVVSVGAERAVQIQAFWKRWASRTGGKLTDPS